MLSKKWRDGFCFLGSGIGGLLIGYWWIYLDSPLGKALVVLGILLVVLSVWQLSSEDLPEPWQQEER